MKKKVFFVGLAIFVSATMAYSQMSIGARLPFQMISYTESKSSEFSSSEMWFGGLGTFEYEFLPILGVETSAGYLMSLGGKSTNEYDETKDEWEYKNDIISTSILLKFYLPAGEESKTRFYFAFGPQISLVTNNDKKNGEYEKNYSLKVMGLGGLTGLIGLPTLKIGLDYSIAETMKLGSLFELGFNNESYTEESKGPTVTFIGFGLGLGFKYCF